MYSNDTRQDIVNTTINQLLLLKDAEDSKNAQSNHSPRKTGKEKILLVEGKSDSKFWKRILSNSVFINDVTDFANSVCKLLNRRTNNKITVVEMCKAFYYSAQFDSVPQINTWEVNGVIDRDFDDQVYEKIHNLHITDTHDLETLLVYSDSGILQRLEIARSYEIQITSEQANTAKRLALQMGWIRMALKTLPLPEKSWFYLPKMHGNGTINYALVNGNGNFDIIQFLREINNLQMLQDRKDDGQLRIVLCHLASSYILRNKISADGKWLQRTISDNELEIWKIINGHDYLNFLKSIVPRAEMAYRSGYQANNALEFDLIKAYNKEKFYETKLYHSMCKNAFIEC